MRRVHLFFVTFEIILLFFCAVGYAQPSITLGQPQIINFSKQQYNGSNQNWALAQDENGFLYSANNKGLLQFDGGTWRLYEMPDKQVVRTVACSKDGKIYTGAFSEIGYWQKDNPFGELRFHSIAPLIKLPVFKQEEIWKIVVVNDQDVLFQSFSRLYRYRNGKVTVINSPSTSLLMSTVRGHYYVPVLNNGLFEVKEDSLVMLSGSEVFKTMEVITVLPGNGNELIIGTAKNGLFTYNNGTVQPFNCPASDFLKANQLNAHEQIDANTYAFGTILSGLIITDAKGNILYHLNPENGLQNNTVLNLCKDRVGNLWVAMDKGIDEVVLNSAFRFCRDVNGKLGPIYAAAIYNNNLYIGSNHGLYVSPINNKQWNTLQPDKFTLFPELKWQVWNLSVFDGQLLCGHNRSTYRIEGNKAIKVGSFTGSWNLKRMRSHPDVLLQGTYNGLAIFKKDALGNWVYHNMIAGTESIPIKRFEEDADGTIWVEHAYKNVYHITLSSKLDTALKVVDILTQNGLPKTEIYTVFNHLGHVMLASPKGVFNYDNKQKSYVENDSLKNSLGEYFYSRRIIENTSGDMWLIKNDNAIAYKKSSSAADIYPFYLKDFSLINGYEAVVPLDEQLVTLGGDDGFALFNKAEFTNVQISDAPIISNIKLNVEGALKSIEELSKTEKISDNKFPYHYRNMVFFVGIPVYDRQIQFSYSIQKNGSTPVWGEWTTLPEKELNNLQPGNYTFRIRTNISNKEASFDFEIMAPWYETILAKCIYALLLAGIILWAVYTHNKKLKKQHAALHERMEKRLQEEKQLNDHRLLVMEQEQLQQEVMGKSEELANSAMSLIRKRKLLQKLRADIDKMKEGTNDENTSSNLHKMLRQLDKHLTEDETEWQLFEKGFNKVHEEFFRRLLSKYSDLTAQDLRLAAYLRMNLASKEIAPLLNITVRGVELKRYRFRKKIGLTADDHLNEFMMKL